MNPRPKIYIIDEQGNRIESKIKWGPSHSGGLGLGPNIRRLPRIKLRRAGDYWEAKWVAQNDSFLAEQHASRVGAIRAVIATARWQRWPLFAPSDPPS